MVLYYLSANKSLFREEEYLIQFLLLSQWQLDFT